jgi:uncharacterized membrane protein
MEAFSDGMIAVIITIMVFGLMVPHEADMVALLPLLPAFLIYVLSFIFLSIYWNNHHHLLLVIQHGRPNHRLEVYATVATSTGFLQNFLQ